MDKTKLRILILRFSVAFVIVWFGVHEILAPQDWIIFVPSFFGGGKLAENLVLIHGSLFCIFGAALVFNFHRKIAALFVSLMILQIIINFLFQTGLSDIVVRDIGIAGLAFSLVF